MSMISVNNLTFCYEGSYDDIFEDVSFNIDTDWKLGFIGIKQAHLYIWDEPLNYINIFTRMQIEDLLIKYRPTMIIVEHDKTFVKNVGTKFISM